MKTVFRHCLPLCAAAMCIFATMYMVVQQYIRLSANEIPAQVATDVKIRLEAGEDATKIMAGMPAVDIGKSLSPFALICNADAAVVAGSGMLNGKYPASPVGSLTFALHEGENRISWQPETGERMATVILPYSYNGAKGYIIAGRSLNEAETRIHFAFLQIAAGAIITLLVIFLFSWLTIRQNQ